MDVGRTWYVKLTQGTIGAVVELGTHHLTHGTTVWERVEVRSVPDSSTERQIIDELYSGLLELLELRCAQGL